MRYRDMLWQIWRDIRWFAYGRWTASRGRALDRQVGVPTKENHHEGYYRREE